MSEQKHTPGPWHRHGSWIHGPEGEHHRSICEVSQDLEGDAELIVSAPTLKTENAALKAEVERLRAENEGLIALNSTLVEGLKTLAVGDGILTAQAVGDNPFALMGNMKALAIALLQEAA